MCLLFVSSVTLDLYRRLDIINDTRQRKMPLNSLEKSLISGSAQNASFLCFWWMYFPLTSVLVLKLSLDVEFLFAYVCKICQYHFNVAAGINYHLLGMSGTLQRVVIVKSGVSEVASTCIWKWASVGEVSCFSLVRVF